jgi:hypothetical protein
MISVDPETWLALNEDEFALRPKVTWHIGGGANAIDVTDRVLIDQLGPVTRSLSPFLGGYRVSECIVTLRNDDGKFTTKDSGSYLALGPEYYYRTKMIVQEGVRRLDGTWEYIDVFTGRVDSINTLPGVIEIKLLDEVVTAMSIPMPEDYAIPLMADAGLFGLTKSAISIMGNLLVNYTYLTSDVTDASTGGILAFRGVQFSWPLSGIVNRGTSIGMAAGAVIRSCLGTMIATENGMVDVVNEYLPRNTVSTGGTWGGDYGTIAFDESNSWNYEYMEPIALFASEVVVSYQSSSIAYRDTAVETQIGRHSAHVDMPFCQHAAFAHWAARLIQETHATFPHLISFVTSGKALLAQLNDVVQVTDPETGVVADCKVVSKEWRPEGIGMTVLRYNSESSLFASSNDWVRYGSSTWGGTDKFL